MRWHAALARSGVSKYAWRSISRAFPEVSETGITRIVAGLWDYLCRVSAEYRHLLNTSLRSGSAVREARLRACGSCGRGRPADPRYRGGTDLTLPAENQKPEDAEDE
jgi:hypothetical protein